MAINTRPPKKPEPSAPRTEPSDEAIDRVMRKAPDYKPETKPPAGQGRPAKTAEKEKGKGYAMGHKRQITHMITPQLLDLVDAEAERNGEARATVINRYIRQGLDRAGD